MYYRGMISLSTPSRLVSRSLSDKGLDGGVEIELFMGLEGAVGGEQLYLCLGEGGDGVMILLRLDKVTETNL